MFLNILILLLNNIIIVSFCYNVPLIFINVNSTELPYQCHIAKNILMSSSDFNSFFNAGRNY